VALNSVGIAAGAALATATCVAGRPIGDSIVGVAGQPETPIGAGAPLWSASTQPVKSLGEVIYDQSRPAH